MYFFLENMLKIHSLLSLLVLL